MHDGLVDHGAMRPFASDDAAIGIFDKLAEDAGLPPILEAQLAKTAALPIAQRMQAASVQLASTGAGPNATRIARAKQASLYDIASRATVVAAFFMEKAASDGSLTDNNENTLSNAVPSDQLASVDNANRPEGTYRTPRGETDLPAPGVIGREVPAPGAPTSGTTVKAAGRFDALIQAIKQRGAGAGTAINDVAEQVPGMSRMRQFAGDVLSNPLQNFRNMQHGAAALTPAPSQPLDAPRPTRPRPSTPARSQRGRAARR
jgi:hypothetical protein